MRALTRWKIKTNAFDVLGLKTLSISRESFEMFVQIYWNHVGKILEFLYIKDEPRKLIFK